MSYDSIDEIAAKVDAGGGSEQFLVRELRNALGYKRTGKHVAVEIAARLQAAGLRLLPSAIPEDQDRFVVLYRPRMNTQAGFLEAVVAMESGREDADNMALFVCIALRQQDGSKATQ